MDRSRNTKPIRTQEASSIEGEDILSVQNISKTYKLSGNKVTALNGVSLQIKRGEFVAIIGPSGSGKSTLLQLMGGLDKPTSGTIVVDGTRLESLSDRRLSRFRNQTVGFVFQFFYLQPFLNLSRNIEVAAMPSRMKKGERKKRIAQLAQRVGLADRLTHYPRELSGGQLQRAAIARALINNPHIIIADEPTGNLDSQNTQEVVDLFRQACRELNTTVVIATHDPMVASKADRTVILKDGALA